MRPSQRFCGSKALLQSITSRVTDEINLLLPLKSSSSVTLLSSKAVVWIATLHHLSRATVRHWQSLATHKPSRSGSSRRHGTSRLLQLTVVGFAVCNCVGCSPAIVWFAMTRGHSLIAFMLHTRGDLLMAPVNFSGSTGRAQCACMGPGVDRPLGDHHRRVACHKSPNRRG